MRSILESLGQGAKASIRYLRNLLGRRVSLLRVLVIGLLAAILIVILADLSAFLRLPFYPFATKGAIYVDSPEVYTRERLVNDRYDQDHWLRRQLEELDAADNLLTGRVTTRRLSGLSVGFGAARSGDRPTAEAPVGGELEPPFDQEFRIRAATRDMIRQMILENMLDDRHDLTGNTVYGLKFDTTVIPGTNTYQRAFVRVALDVEPLFTGQGDSVDGLPSHVRQFFDLGFARIEDRHDNPMFKLYDLYRRWLENVEVRLNDYLSVLLQGACGQETRVDPREEAWLLHDTTWKVLEIVLGIDQRPGWNADESTAKGSESTDSRATALPDPWVDFLNLQQVGDLCEKRLRFVVEPLFESIYIFPAADDSLWADLWGQGSDPLNLVEIGYFPVLRTTSGEQVAVEIPMGSIRPENNSIRSSPTTPSPISWLPMLEAGAGCSRLAPSSRLQRIFARRRSSC